MAKIAFFVDGNFLFQQVKLFRSFFANGPNIKAYCERHLEQGDSIYRIFYYDAPPLERIGTTPNGSPIDFNATLQAQRMKEKLESIKTTPYFALRLGKTTWQNDWLIKDKALKDLRLGVLAATNLTDSDFRANIQQKAVDMKIGLDIATVAFKKLADTIVLIAGDADFTPAAKLARTEGLRVIIDPLGKKIPADLIEHVDYVRTMLDVNNPADVNTNQNFFVVSPKTL